MTTPKQPRPRAKCPEVFTYKDGSTIPIVRKKQPRPRAMDREMRCNYCLGQMQQSLNDRFITICYTCNMRHDWRNVIVGAKVRRLPSAKRRGK